MKISDILIISSLLTLLLSSCKEKEVKQDIIVPAPVEKKVTGPQQMPDTKQERDIEWLGSTYHITIIRSVCDSLPKAKDEDGNAYYDNTISLCIQRPDGSNVVNRTFTKASFNSYISGSGMEKDGALLGIVFDKVENGCLVFATSVGSPDIRSDAFVPMVMKVDRNGQITVSLDTKLDSGSDIDMDDEDGV